VGNLSFYIARRYFSTKKRKHAVNWITSISVIGIAIITASLIILLSAFNGIESIIEKLYSDFDPQITIKPTTGKTISERALSFEKVKSVPQIKRISRAVEEIVVVKHDSKWVNARLIGAEPSFLKMCKLPAHALLVRHQENQILRSNELILGVELASKLELLVSQQHTDQVTLYAPKRNAKMRLGSSPFNTGDFLVQNHIGYNREVNEEVVLVNLQQARELLDYSDEISALYVEVEKGSEWEVKSKLQSMLGKQWEVKTNYEKNELIFKTSKSEKLIVFIILLFIFMLAAFNLVASLTILFNEKLPNLKTLITFGATRKQVFKIFLYQGMLISGKGILIGLLLGYGVCLIQLQLGLIQLPGFEGGVFPVRLSLSDGCFIITSVVLLSYLFTFWPVRYLIGKNLETQFKS
jgi:lipoprotein-releasing system permease protein